MEKTWASPTWKTPLAFPTFPQLRRRVRFIELPVRILGAGHLALRACSSPPLLCTIGQPERPCAWPLLNRFPCILLLGSLPLYCQSNSGELRLRVIDASGRTVRMSVSILSEANQYRNILKTDEAASWMSSLCLTAFIGSTFSRPGSLRFRRLPSSDLPSLSSKPSSSNSPQSINL